MRVGSLFSGIGGIDLGFEQAGHETVFQAEIDEACRAVLERHFPNAKRFDDVQTVGKANLPACDVLVGGFPCQDLSVAGKRKGLAGERSGLFHEFMRIASELSPTWVLIENVPGLLSSNDGRDMGVVIGTLAELGYGVGWRVLDSQYFGLAQRRKRVFIVGSFGTPDGCTLLLEPESCDRDLAPSREKGSGVAAFSAGQSAGAGSLGYRDEQSPTLRGSSGGNQVPTVAGTLQASGAGTSRPAGMASEPDFLVEIATKEVASTLQGHNWRNDVEGSEGGHLVTMMRWREGKEGGGKGELLSEEQSLTLATANDQVMFHSIQEGSVGDVTELTEVSTTLSGNGGKPGQGYPAVRVSPTLRGFGHGWQGQHNDDVSKVGLVRRLTPTECERLQGFPDGWTDGQSDSTRYRQLGNAVSVPVAKWIAERLP